MVSKMSNNTWLQSLGQHSGHAMTGYRVPTKDRTSARTSREMVIVPMEALNVLKHVHFIFFLHTEVNSERTSLMQGCTPSKMSRFYALLNVLQRHKKGWISSKIPPIVTPSHGMMPCKYGTNGTKR